MKKLIVDCTTGETQEVEYTAEEIKQAEIDAENWRILREQQAVELENLNILKQSARAKLVSGSPLTEEEAATIVL
jgi:hypothetical protein